MISKKTFALFRRQLENLYIMFLLQEILAKIFVLYTQQNFQLYIKIIKFI